MSFSGQSPTAKRTRYTPQSADPVNPIDGDLFFSNGTPRAEGLWVWFNAAWQQVSTSGALSDVNSLTFIPQSSDPGSPTTGMVFYADGTSRAEGLWYYNGTGWVQLSGSREIEYTLKAAAAVRVATTVNLTLASQVENGDTIDGVVLATGNRVLVKNQSTATENGVYTVNASGPPTRATDADTFSELNDYVATVTNGTVNANSIWFQTAVLTSLADNQVWAATPATKTFTVPEGVTQIRAIIAGGGGGGGGGGHATGNVAGSTGCGGGGGGGGPVQEITFTTIPGDILTITRGTGGIGGIGTATNGTNGANGVASTITGTDVNVYAPGGGGGGGGGHAAGTTGSNGNNSDFAAGGAGGSFGGTEGGGGGGGGHSPGGAGATTAAGSPGFWGAGGGGGINTSAGIGGAGGKSQFVTTGAAGGASAGNAGGGGGGGSGFAIGGTGGMPNNVGNDAAINSAGGGGGGSGLSVGGGGNGLRGGRGGTGWVKLIW